MANGQGGKRIGAGRKKTSALNTMMWQSEIYLEKYYPKGYNLLAKTLNTQEKSERSCYD